MSELLRVFRSFLDAGRVLGRGIFVGSGGGGECALADAVFGDPLNRCIERRERRLEERSLPWLCGCWECVSSTSSAVADIDEDAGAAEAASRCLPVDD